MTETDAIARRRAPWLVAACALLWSLNGPIIKLLTAAPHQQDGVAIALWRSAIAAAALAPFVLPRLSRVPRSIWWLPATISFAAMCGCFVTANQHTEAANAIVIQYTAPFWIFLLSPLLLREWPQRREWIVLPIAMSGIAVIFIAQFDSAGLGLLLGLGSGIAFAFVMLSFRRLRAADALAAPCIANLATAVLLALVAIALNGRLSMPSRIDTWAWVAFLGLVQMALPYALLATALRHVTAAEASLISLIELVMNPTWTYFWIGEVPRLSTLAGGGLIVAALLLKNLLDRQAAARAPART